MSEGTLESGRPWPLGAYWDGRGVNFALFSEHAERVDLYLPSIDGARTLTLPGRTDDVWHGYLAGAAPGLRYNYRVHGPDAPESGHRFDPRCLLIDPHAREVHGGLSWRADAGGEGLCASVVDEPFDWGDDTPPAVTWADTVLYEVHVKGATRCHPDVPESLRGTYAGLASPAMLRHFKRLGVTTVNLLPVQAFVDEQRLVRNGLVNYWGYNPIAFLAPESRYAAGVDGESVTHEFRRMVRCFHAAGIEVILDLVFNHTAETDETGPTLSLRGIDNRSYYRLASGNPAQYENFSGCGNTLNLAHPRVLQLVMDALRYWFGEMHVDGFRFDLATALVRDSAFLAAILQDPLLARAKLIAEPWDLGPDGYRLGRFPPGWGEWNDRFRDGVRAFWLTATSSRAELARRLAGSSELFRVAGRAPQAGVNFITAHDGFTLRDLVSYSSKHNELNGENNADGHSCNHSWNCGVEGETDDPVIRERRSRLCSALLATLFVAQGVPMLQAGDEIGRTQCGNNNAYCQDNELTWLDWQQADDDLAEYVAGLTALRRSFPLLRQDEWLTGKKGADGNPDVLWWHPGGRPMGDADWYADDGAFGFRLASTAGAAPALLCLLNRGCEAAEFVLPVGEWLQILDSASRSFAEVRRERTVSVAERCVLMLVEQR